MHLADDATYQEVVCRSALNRVKGMPFRWTLNPYRGCTHGCHYCFARRYQHQLELDAGDAFSSVVLVKTNFPEVLRRELDRPRWRPELVAFGTATDPYQPIEGRYQITRRSLMALAANPTPVGLITKGPMVVRDRDLLVELSRRTACTVSVSVPTVDEDAWRALEPGTAHPLQRLRAVRALTDAGVDAGVLMAPIVSPVQLAPGKARTDHQGDRRPWRALRRRVSHASRRRHARPLPVVRLARVSGAGGRLRTAVCGQVRRKGLHRTGSNGSSAR